MNVITVPFVIEIFVIIPVLVWLVKDFSSIKQACETSRIKSSENLKVLRAEAEILSKLVSAFLRSPSNFVLDDKSRPVFEKISHAPQIDNFAETKAKAQSLVFIGLIGTVIGISISTFTLAIGVTRASGDSGDIVKEMSKMLTTLPIAFIVTFVAVLLSVISSRITYSVISLHNTIEEVCGQNNYVRHFIQQARAQNKTNVLLASSNQQLKKLVDQEQDLSSLSDSIEVVKKTAESLSTQQSTLVAMVRDLAKPMTDASDGLTNFGKTLDTSVQKLMPAAEKVAETMSSVRETTGVIDEAYNKLFGVSDRLDNVAAYLVSDAFRASSQVIGEMTNRQHQFLSRMDESLSSQVSLIQQSISQQQLLQSNFIQLLAAYEAMQRDQIPVVSDLKLAVQAQTEWSTSLTSQAQSLTESTSKLSTSIEQNNSALSGFMSKSNKTMESMLTTLGEIAERFNARPFWPNFPVGKPGKERNQ